MPSNFDDECFFIAPIGPDESDIRKRSNAVRDWVVKPAAAAAAELRTIRADDVGEPGQITAQAIQHCLKAKAAVADLTGGNPNVYYELSVRHGAQLPVALIAETGTKLPFDISQSRVIFFDHRDLSSAGKAREDLQTQIRASLAAPPDNPIYDGMRLAQLQAGNAEEQTLAVVMDRLERLSHTTEMIDRRLARAERDAEVARTVQFPRGEIRNNAIADDVAPGQPFRWRRVVTEDGEVIEQREYVPAFDLPGDLTDEEKAEILAEVRAVRQQNPLSNGDPEAG